MTPHDSTRCACGHEWSRHNARGCQSHKGKFLCKCPIPALPTEGVGAVDFAAADWIAGEWKDIDKYMPETANLARAYIALREQVATLTAIAKREKVAALNATEDAYRARATPAEAVAKAYADSRGRIYINDSAPLAAIIRAKKPEYVLLYAAPVPSGVTESANDRFERLAEAFYDATRKMAPGKDVPMAMGADDADERMALWKAFNAGYRAALDAARTPHNGGQP